MSRPADRGASPDVAAVLVDLCGAAHFFALQLRGETDKGADHDQLTQTDLLVLVHAIRHPGTTRIQTAENLGVAARTVETSVRALVRRQLLTTHGDPRNPSSVATAVGVKTTVSAIERAEQRMRYVLAGLSAENEDLLRQAAPAIAALSDLLGIRGTPPVDR